MSIQSEINRINNNVQSTLNIIADTGVTVGSGSDALPAAAAALANEKANANHTHPTYEAQISELSSQKKYIAQSEAPEDTSVLWIDTDDESEQEGMFSNPLVGKSITFNGDSICAGVDGGGGYGKIIADRNSMIYQNVAHGGATITAETYSKSTGNALHWICRTISDMDATADYAIVEGGVNDAGYVDDMGSLSSGFVATLDDTTFYGAFESMLKQLITRFAGKKVGYIAVHKCSDTFSNLVSGGYYEAAKKCCEKWGVPFCDLNTTVPPLKYIADLSAAYTTDGTHPNEAGYKKYYCDKIEAWLKTL